MDLTELTTKPDLVKEGVWTSFKDAKLRIASTDSTAYKRALSRHGRNFKAGELRNKPELAEQITIKAMAEAILLDFTGITEGGKPMEATRENCEKLLQSKVIRDFVAEFADDYANFQKQADIEAEEDLKSDAAMAAK
jgi:hypothetical protein